MQITEANDHASGVPTLSELIAERKRLRGFSYADLENRAGSVITRQRWQQLGTGARIKEFPEPATLEAMALALDADVAEVVLAAGRSIGLNIKRGAHTDLAARLPATSDRLTETQRDAIVTLVRSITETADDVDATEEQGTPSTPSKSQKNNVRALKLQNQAPDIDDDDLPPAITEADAARTEPGYVKSGDRPENHPNE